MFSSTVSSGSVSTDKHRCRFTTLSDTLLPTSAFPTNNHFEKAAISRFPTNNRLEKGISDFQCCSPRPLIRIPSSGKEQRRKERERQQQNALDYKLQLKAPLPDGCNCSHSAISPPTRLDTIDPETRAHACLLHYSPHNLPADCNHSQPYQKQTAIFTFALRELSGQTLGSEEGPQTGITDRTKAVVQSIGVPSCFPLPASFTYAIVLVAP